MVHKLNVGQVKNVLLFDYNTNPNPKLISLFKNELLHNLNLESTDDLQKTITKLKNDNLDLLVINFGKNHNSPEIITKIRNLVQNIPIVLICDTIDLNAEILRDEISNDIYSLSSSLDKNSIADFIKYTIELNRVKTNLHEARNELAQSQLRLKAIEQNDALTEVLSASGLAFVLQNEFFRAQRGGWALSAILVDLDDFGRINATFGHATGDIVLKETANRLKDTLRPTDYIARIGGDKFLILLPETRLAEAILVAEKIRLSVGESPMRLANETIRLTASLGVLALPYNFCSIEEIVSLARHAVSESKSAGKNRVTTAEAKSAENIQSPDYKQALDQLLEQLRQGDCFKAVSMPLLSLSDEKLMGYEILSRGPAGAFEMPDDLFRVSIEHNLLTIVDLRCLKTCLNATVDPKFDQNVCFHVNLFPSTIIDTPIDRLLTLFPDNKKDGNFCIEISEQQFIGDPTYLRDHVHTLRENGILVAIDDVGFGRSSLESLILLEPDIVKIDRKYVSGAYKEPAKARLLTRLIKVIQALGSDLIAEGIEEREDLEFLLENGVKYGQGWYWGKPS